MRFAALLTAALACLGGCKDDGNTRPGAQPGAFDTAKAKGTRVVIDAFTNQAFLMWQTKNDAPCPESLAALEPFVDKKPVDDWGHPLMMACDPAAGGLRIWSVGADGKSETADDIVSAQALENN